MAKVPPWVWSGDSARLLTQNILVSGVTVSATELGYLDGVTSAIQTQIDSKTGIADNETITGNWTFSNIITGSITGNAGTVTNGVYTTGDQSIAGIKTFSSTIVGSISGNAGTVTNGVYTTGDQSIAGIKTFSSTIVGSISGNAGTVTNGAYINVTNSFTSTQNILATTNQLVLGTTNTTTISATAPAASAVYTIPDVGTTADFVLTAGAQTIGGAKTFSGAITLSGGVSGNIDATGKGFFNNTLKVTGNLSGSDYEANSLLLDNNAGNSRLYSVGPDAATRGSYEIIGRSSDGSSISTYAVITNGGNVGIGTASPTNRLQVHYSDQTAGVLFLNTATSGGVRAGVVQNQCTNGDFVHYTVKGQNFEWLMGLRNSNEFRISTLATWAAPYFQIGSTGAVTLGPSGGTSTHTVNGPLTVDPGGTTGNFTVSSSTLANQVLLNNGIVTRFGGTVVPNTDNAFDLGSGTNRWDDVFATNGTIQTSDARDKEDIGNLDLGLDFVSKLRPVNFRWIGGVRKHQGFIAQELEQAILDSGKTTQEVASFIKADLDQPEGDRTDRYGIRYGELIAPMVKAIQELHAELQTLKGA